jgi:hypothetical protein
VDSGLSMKVWCSQNNIKLSAFKYWDNKFKKAEKTDTGWTELRVQPDEEYSPPVLQNIAPIILHVKEFSIRIPVGFDKETLAGVISVLQRPC